MDYVLSKAKWMKLRLPVAIQDARRTVAGCKTSYKLVIWSIISHSFATRTDIALALIGRIWIWETGILASCLGIDDNEIYRQQEHL